MSFRVPAPIITLNNPRRCTQWSVRLCPIPLALLIVLAGCSHSESAPPPRYAFLGFENLSGDASLEWTDRGAGDFLSRSLRDAMGPAGVLSPDAIARAGQPLGSRIANAPDQSTERTAALTAGANRIVSGYVEHIAAGVRITASEEDTVTHRTVRTLSVTAPTPFEAFNLLAHQFSPQAGPGPSGNSEAFRLYCTATQSPVSEALAPLERAVTLDPGFGRAWIALARTFIAAGNRQNAADVIRRATAQKLAPLDRAWLNFEDAALSGDRSASLAAMRKVSELELSDAGLARSLASAEINAGNFKEAAAVWKRLTVNAPGDADAWNQLGYSLCWSGDYTGALAAVHEYARQRPNDANPLDSEGDIHYWFGKFSEAAASYSAAQAKAPKFLNGGDLYKSAWSRFHAGDKAGADGAFQKFREAREKLQDPTIDLFAGDWLYRTGRVKEARALLEGPSGKGTTGRPPALRTAIGAQLALWDLLANDRAAAARDLAAGGNAGMTAADVVLKFAALATASAPEWEARAGHLLAAPQFAGIRASALGYALILDGRKQAAIGVWEKIVSQSPGSDFFSRNLLARLKDQALEHQPPPDPVNLNPFAVVLDKL